MNWIDPKLYNQILANIPIVCIDVAVTYNSKILLIKRRDEPAANEWWLPGGRLHKGESLTGCALRKAQEETGLVCRIGPMVHYQSTVFDNVHSVNFCYALTASDDGVQLDDTCLDYEWVAGMRYGLHDYVVNCLSKAFDWVISGMSAYES